MILLYCCQEKDDQLAKVDFRLACLTVATKDYPVLKVPAFVGNIKRTAILKLLTCEIRCLVSNNVLL